MAKKKVNKKAERKLKTGKKAIDKTGILKIPVYLDDFKWRKQLQDWGITFALQPELIVYGQPLQKMMNKHFVAVLYPISSVEEKEEILKSNDHNNMAKDLEFFLNEK